MVRFHPLKQSSIFAKASLAAVIDVVKKLMKRGHPLACFVSDTQVLRREKFEY